MSYLYFLCQPYIAIIGDIKNSKKIKNRDCFQQKFKEILDQVNIKYADDIASKFIITLGDEFQGLLFPGKSLIEILLYIKNEIYPYEIRFGIGMGAITTKINKEFALGADGPGYYKARNSIEALKKLEKKREIAITDVLIEIDEENHNRLQELALNTIFKLMYAIEKKWTKKQREAILYMLINNANQLDTSKHFEVSPSNINQILSKGNFNVYKESFDNLKEIMDDIYHYVRF